MTFGTTIIPALPGTYTLDRDYIGRSPVVAWAVKYSEGYDCDNFFTTTHPVTLGYGNNYPDCESPNSATVLHPCGAVEELATGFSWDTYEAFVKHKKEKNDTN